MHCGKRQGTTLHRSPVHHRANTQRRAALCEKKSERGSLLTLCVFSWVWSHKPGINAQRGPSVLPVVRRASGSLSQPHSFHCTLPSLTHTHTQCLPPARHLLFRCLTLCPNFCEQVHYCQSSCLTAPPSMFMKTATWTRGASEERSTGGGGGGGGGGGQQLRTWKNNSCDSRIVIPTFVSCWVQQQVSSRHGNRRANPALHPRPHRVASTTFRMSETLFRGVFILQSCNYY